MNKKSCLKTRYSIYVSYAFNFQTSVCRGISAQDMKYILDFMYHGEVNVAQEELDKFLEVAETLKIKGLTQGSNGSRQASKRPAASSAVSSSPSPGEPRKKPKMHSAVTPSTPSSAPKTEAEVSVKTETGPSVPVGAEDFEESVGGEDDYGKRFYHSRNVQFPCTL